MLVFLAAVICPVAIYFLGKSFNFTKFNYRKKAVVKSLGYSLVIFSLSITLIGMLAGPATNLFSILLIIAAPLGSVGLLDDIYGSDKYKGLKGHFKALLKGKVTTGLLKAVTGLVVGAVIAYMFDGALIEIIFKTLTFGLCVNFFNLMDLRPGRVLKVYLIVILGFIMYLIYLSPQISIKNSLSIINAVKDNVFTITMIMFLPATVLLFFDLREYSMLGDAGSNILGGFVGLLIVIIFNIYGTLIAFIILLSLHVLAEFISFSEVISKNPALRWIDNLGRIK